MSSRVGDEGGEGEGGVGSRGGSMPCLRKASSLVKEVYRPWLDVIWPGYMLTIQCPGLSSSIDDDDRSARTPDAA